MEDGKDNAADPEDHVIYVISDLHIGGDEQLEEVDFLPELLGFLRRLEETDEDAELVINGDVFGFWELTTREGTEKFDILTETYPELFEQLKATGENVEITVIPGNHDHDLAAYPEYEELLDKYNIKLNRSESTTRQVGSHTVYFEHGHQRDPNNRIEDWGNPQEKPLGYYLNTRVTSRAGKLSHRGRYNWLKDLQAITPTERIPVWMLSKYFYREMNPILRYALAPFLLLFYVSMLIAVIAGLGLSGIWETPIRWTTDFLRNFGAAGTAIWALLAVDIAVGGLLLLIAVPLHLIRNDIKKTFDRFGVFETDITVNPDQPYVETAKEIFQDNPEVSVYCYGHTHRTSLKEVEGRFLVNTGTWLKRLHRRDGVIGLLPPVFYPSYQLSAVRLAANGNGELNIEFQEIEKPSPGTDELTLTERLLTLGRAPDPGLPERVTVKNPGERSKDKPK
ncbi:MAG: metallophosphoesterase [Halobacteria archaeon]